MVQVRGARAVGPCIMVMVVATLYLLILLLLLKLSRQVGETLFVLREYGVDGKVDIAIGSDAAELLSDVVNYWLAAVVKVGLLEVPLLTVADHGVQFVHGGNEGELCVLQYLCVSAKRCKSMNPAVLYDRWGKRRKGVPSWQLLELCLLSCACCADQSIVLAPLAGKFSVALSMCRRMSVTRCGLILSGADDL